MKRLLHFWIFLIVLTVSGWSNASPLDIIELCGDFDVLKDPENRVYRGQYKHRGVVLETALVVTPITRGGETVVFYVSGKQPKWNISTAGCWPATGTEKGDTLTIYWQKIRVTYKFSGDEATVKYKRGGETTKGKVALSQMTISNSSTTSAQQAEEASLAAAPGKRRILTEQEFQDAVVGRQLINEDGNVVIHDDGTLTGKFNNKKLTGKWTWEDQFYCRTVKLGSQKLGRDCQTIFVEGDTLTGRRKQGKGKTFTYRLQNPDS